MNHRGSVLIYLAVAILIISIIGGITFYLKMNNDEKTKEQKKQDMERQVKKTFAPDLQLMDQ